MIPYKKLLSFSLLVTAVSPLAAADIYEEVLGATAVTVSSALGTSFLVNDATTGGNNHETLSFNRDYASASALYATGASVTINGIAWASPATGTTATSATVTLTDWGPDEAHDTGDDRVLGVVTDDLTFTDAGVYVWEFGIPIAYTASGAGLRMNITSNAAVIRKTSNGTTGEANVKISISGTATGGAPPPITNTAESSGDWGVINWARENGSLSGDIPAVDTVQIGDDMSVTYNGVPASEQVSQLQLGHNANAQNLGQGRLDVASGTLTVTGALSVGLDDSLNDSFLTVSGTGSLAVGGNASFGNSAPSADGSLLLEGSGQLSVAGNLNMGGFGLGGSMMRFELPGNLPSVAVTGAVDLSRCALELSFATSYTHAPGATYTLVTYGLRNGQFMNFREGDAFNSGPNRFRINYDVSGHSIVLTALPNFTTTNPNPPNIIYILVDDQGYADNPLNSFSVGGHGDKDWSTVFPMPNLESLASNGVRFTNGYVTGGVCHPSRAGILTGIYQQRFGADNNLPENSMNGISPAARTIPRRLQSLGYRTYGVGKWHLGETVENHPNNRGFNGWYGMWLGSRSYYSVIGDSQEELRVFQNNMLPDYVAENQAQNNYLTDRIGDKAVAFIDEHAINHATQPFYLYLSFTSPHGPIDIEPTDPRFAEMSSAYGLDLSDYAGISSGIAGTSAATTQQKRYSLAAMCFAHDQNIGKVLNKLVAEGLLDNTIVVYQSDNGGTGSNSNYSINLPLVGTKGGNCLEGSFRVPTVLQWPAQFAGAQVLDTPVTSLDIAATFVNACGAPAHARNGLDGLDLFDYIKDGTPLPADRVLTFRGGGTHSGGSAIRMGDYKLHINDGSTVSALYDFSDATPGVVDGKYGEYAYNTISDPELEAELLKRFKAWEVRAVAPYYNGHRSVPDVDLEYYPLVGAHRLLADSGATQFLSAVFREPLPVAADWTRNFFARATEATNSANAKLVYAFGDDAHPDAGSYNNPDYLVDMANIRANRSNMIQCIIDYGSGQLAILDGRAATSSTAAIPLEDLPRAFTVCTIDYQAASNELTFSVNGSRVTHTLSGGYSDLIYYAAGVADMEVEVTPLRTHEDAMVNLTLLGGDGLRMDVEFLSDLPFTMIGQSSTDLLSFSDDPNLLIESLGGGHYQITGSRGAATAAFYRLKNAPRSGN